MLNDRNSTDLALRALRDCGAIRVRIGAVPIGYQLLQRRKLISARPSGQGFAIVRLNEAGEQWASKLLPWSATA